MGVTPSGTGVRAGFRDAENTRSPAAARRRTVARPMPLLPPVTKTTAIPQPYRSL